MGQQLETIVGREADRARTEAGKRTQKRWMNVLRVLISAGALAFLSWKIGLGETLDVLRQADLRYLLAVFLLYIFSLVIRAYRWYLLLSALDGRPPFLHLLYLYYLGFFFNNFIPSGFGGDVIKVLGLRQEYGREV